MCEKGRGAESGTFLQKVLPPEREVWKLWNGAGKVSGSAGANGPRGGKRYIPGKTLVWKLLGDTGFRRAVLGFSRQDEEGWRGPQEGLCACFVLGTVCLSFLFTTTQCCHRPMACIALLSPLDRNLGFRTKSSLATSDTPKKKDVPTKTLY